MNQYEPHTNLLRFPLDSNRILITQFSQISKLGHCEFTPKTISMKIFKFFLQLTLISPQSILIQTNAAMATNSPVKYESSYKSKDLEKAKFTQYFDDGTNSKETCDKYNGREESVLEVIHYTTERYKRIADKMQWTWREKFDHYEEIIEKNAHIFIEQRTKKRSVIKIIFFCTFFVPRWTCDFKSRTNTHFIQTIQHMNKQCTST